MSRHLQVCLCFFLTHGKHDMDKVFEDLCLDSGGDFTERILEEPVGEWVMLLI